MKKIIILFFLTNVVFAQKNQPWKVIFDGKTFKNWDTIGSDGIINIKDSCFVIGMKANTPEHTFLKTKKKYKNFILELDFKKDTEFNSGILFRANPTPDTSSVSLYGYQIKLDPSVTRRWTGGIFDDFGKTWSWIYPLKDDPKAMAAEKLGEWNHVRIEMINTQIKVWINGVPTANIMNDKYKKAGYIAFKMHSLGNKPEQEKWKSSFKNIRIIEKNVKKYANPIDLSVSKKP